MLRLQSDHILYFNVRTMILSFFFHCLNNEDTCQELGAGLYRKKGDSM